MTSRNPNGSNKKDQEQSVAPFGVTATTSTAAATTTLRRSKRNFNAIKLSGGAYNQTFFRRLDILFFNPKTRVEDYQRILSSKRNDNINNSNSKKDQVTLRSVQRVTKRRQAPIYVLDNFLTASELDYFDQKIQQQQQQHHPSTTTTTTSSSSSSSCPLKFERSFVDIVGYNGDSNIRCQNEQEEQIGDNDVISQPLPKTRKCTKKRSRTMVDDKHRTSTFYSFRKLHDTRIAALEQRIATLLGCWVHQIEPLQLVRYQPGQFFGIHHDMGILLDDDTVLLPHKDFLYKRRLVTIFCYLNSLEQQHGGATYFPQCNHLRVTPQRGRAVLWSNVTADGQPDARTIHAGEVVLDHHPHTSCKGIVVDANPPTPSSVVKYGLNIWICEE
jgi:hypothetical protein